MSNDTITLEQQEAMGLRQPRRNYITPAASLPRRDVPAAPVNAEVNHTIDAAPVSTQHVEMKTSAVDRALGFLIATLPLCGAFAITVVGIVVLGFGVPLMSLPTLVIAFIVFVTVWIVAYLYTLYVSAEGVAMYEAQSKWDVIRTEQMLRWKAWLLERGE